MGEDVIGSGPGRPPRVAVAVRRRVRRLARRLRALDRRHRRIAAATLATVAAVAVLAALRAGVPEAGQPAAAGRPTRTAVPLGTLPTPPFGALPGRTPIPAPSLLSEDGQTVGGELPVFAPAPSELAVRIAVRLILDWFCRDPMAHAIQLQHGVGQSWRSATAIVWQERLPLTYRPEITLRLTWTGYTYRWRGSLYQLADCA